MYLKTIIAILCLAVAVFAYCYSKENTKDNSLHSSIITVKKWSDSLIGKSEKQIANMFPKQKPVRSTWLYEKKQEPLLTYQYQNTEVEVVLFFYDKKVILSTVEFDSK